MTFETIKQFSPQDEVISRFPLDGAIHEIHTSNAAHDETGEIEGFVVTNASTGEEELALGLGSSSQWNALLGVVDLKEGTLNPQLIARSAAELLLSQEITEAVIPPEATTDAVHNTIIGNREIFGVKNYAGFHAVQAASHEAVASVAA